MEHCSLKCPSGSDDECPTLSDGTELKCLSGVSDCKNEMGLGVYDNNGTSTTDAGVGGDGVGDVEQPGVVVNVDLIAEDFVLTGHQRRLKRFKFVHNSRSR